MHDALTAPLPASWLSSRLGIDSAEIERLRRRGELFGVRAGDEEAHFVCEVRPALQFERLLETMFALAADGRTNRKGMPNPLQLAVIAQAHFDTVQLPFLPALLQRIALALGAPFGRLLGYSATYMPGEVPSAPLIA